MNMVTVTAATVNTAMRAMTVTPVTTPMTNPDAIPVAPSNLCVGNTSAEQR